MFILKNLSHISSVPCTLSCFSMLVTSYVNTAEKSTRLNIKLKCFSNLYILFDCNNYYIDAEMMRVYFVAFVLCVSFTLYFVYVICVFACCSTDDICC